MPSRYFFELLIKLTFSLQHQMCAFIVVYF